jgi:hypothetical protein
MDFDGYEPMDPVALMALGTTERRLGWLANAERGSGKEPSNAPDRLGIAFNNWNRSGSWISMATNRWIRIARKALGTA